MAVLDKKEQKIQAVLGRLPKKYTHEQFVEMFIKLYSKDWGKIKSAYVKQNQDKEPGTVVNMPKPDLYLKQLLEIYLTKNTTNAKDEVKAEAAKAEEVVEKVVKKAKAAAKPKQVETNETQPAVAKKVKSAKTLVADEAEVVPAKKVKTPAKDKVTETTVVKKSKATKTLIAAEVEVVPVKKVKTPAKAKVAKENEVAENKKPKAAAKKKSEAS